MSEQPGERADLISGDETQKVEKKILQAIKSLNYGSVEIIIHDSKVVQIERKERIRFDKHS